MMRYKPLSVRALQGTRNHSAHEIILQKDSFGSNKAISSKSNQRQSGLCIGLILSERKERME
jgi:hypothetical protein